MSCSITAHERSSSAQVLAVSKMVLNKVKAMLVWSLRPGSILGCLVIGIVMRKRKKVKESKTKVEIFNDNHEYNQPERYGRSPQYGRQINVEEKV
jgi:hypothetical protein